MSLADAALDVNDAHSRWPCRTSQVPGRRTRGRSSGASVPGRQRTAARSLAGRGGGAASTAASSVEGRQRNCSEVVFRTQPATEEEAPQQPTEGHSCAKHAPTASADRDEDGMAILCNMVSDWVDSVTDDILQEAMFEECQHMYLLKRDHGADSEDTDDDLWETVSTGSCWLEEEAEAELSKATPKVEVKVVQPASEEAREVDGAKKCEEIASPAEAQPPAESQSPPATPTRPPAAQSPGPLVRQRSRRIIGATTPLRGAPVGRGAAPSASLGFLGQRDLETISSSTYDMNYSFNTAPGVTNRRLSPLTGDSSVGRAVCRFRASSAGAGANAVYTGASRGSTTTTSAVELDLGFSVSEAKLRTAYNPLGKEGGGGFKVVKSQSLGMLQPTFSTKRSPSGLLPDIKRPQQNMESMSWSMNMAKSGVKRGALRAVF